MFEDKYNHCWRHNTLLVLKHTKAKPPAELPRHADIRIPTSKWRRMSLEALTNCCCGD